MPIVRPRDLELVEAQLSEALDSVHDLLAIMRRNGGYTTPEQQAVLRYARAVLAGAGRPVP
jgi:hypothetical protein